MKFLSSTFTIIAIASCLNSCMVSKNTETSRTLAKADHYMEMRAFHAALPIYEEMFKTLPDAPQLHLKAGICLLRSNRAPEAIKHLERSAQQGVSLSHLYLGQAYHSENRLDDAIAQYLLFKERASKEEYLEHDVDRHLNITSWAKMMMNQPVDVRIENVGPAINSPFADYVPVISANESVMIFTSRREGSTGGNKDSNGRYFEDIYISRQKDGNWTPSEKLKGVNTEFHDACVGLSADGQKMILYKMNENHYGGDLYISKLEGDVWLTPEKIADEVNSDYWEPSGSLSHDEKILYFSSNRPGGYGGLDIYMTRKLPDGTWAVPSNLGPVVNTPYDEDAPFIHPDGRTLYFSSKGHQNMGGYDIFRTVYSGDSRWSLPENLGYPINTVGDDIYFVLSANGKRGYYSSDKKGGSGGQDIYVIHMPQENVPLTIITGQVMHADDQRPVQAVVTILDIKTKEVQGIYRPNRSTGNFIIILPPGKSFRAVVEADGFHAYTEDIEVSEETEYTELIKKFYLKKK